MADKVAKRKALMLPRHQSRAADGQRRSRALIWALDRLRSGATAVAAARTTAGGATTCLMAMALAPGRVVLEVVRRRARKKSVLADIFEVISFFSTITVKIRSFWHGPDDVKNSYVKIRFNISEKEGIYPLEGHQTRNKRKTICCTRDSAWIARQRCSQVRFKLVHYKLTS